MRFDNKVKPELNLTSRQQLFGEVWFNLVHEHSLDTFRVRTMNPVNIVNELVRSFTVILMLSLWGKKQKEDKDTGAPALQSLILAYGRELQCALSKTFLGSCIDWLSTEMALSVVSQTDSKTEGIIQITGQMMSHLISIGWSFESLFQLYRRTFSADIQHTPEGQAYAFGRALKWLFDRLARKPKDYQITFIINQVYASAELPAQMGEITFSPNPPKISDTSSGTVKRIAQATRGRIFASMTVKANDSRIAGMRAAEQIEKILDVLRYDFIKQNFSLSDRFMVQKENGHIALDVAKTLPNEKQEATAEQLHTFMAQLRNLAANETLEGDSKDRIYSTFRLYRTGAETANLENKLVQWWTALEYLVKAGGGNIGDAVERALYPAVVLAYLPKHLNAMRSALIEFDVPLTLTYDTSANLTSYSMATLFDYCKDQSFRNRATAAAGAKSAYAHHYFVSFFKKIQDSKSILATLEKHEKAVRWQIQRIYRARCDIVHSAGRVRQAPLLCANLESYLKILLDTFLISLQKIDTLRTPKEFFDRQQYGLTRIKDQLGLKAGASETLLVHAFSRQQ